MSQVEVMNYLLPLPSINQVFATIMTKLNTPSFLLFSMMFCISLGVFGQFNQLDVEQIKPIDALNTKAEENVPVVNNAGDEMYFMRTYIGRKKLSKSGQEIWSSNFNGEQWESPTEKQLSVNDNANNAVIGISKDNQRIYLFNSLDTRHKLAKGLGYVEMDEKGKYSSPIGIDIPGFEVGNGYYSFYVTPDEQQFFIAAALDSSGYEDLYVSLRQTDGSWGEIISLGNQINTPTIETTPFLTEDKRTLYFSSDGHGGEGQADIFYTERIGEGWTNWSKPVNMGSPINSPKFDANFILINNGGAVFSSNRESELSDLYQVVFTKEDSSRLLTISKNTYDSLIYGSLNIVAAGLVKYDSFALVINKSNEAITDTVFPNETGSFDFRRLDPCPYRISFIDEKEEELTDLILINNLVVDSLSNAKMVYAYDDLSDKLGVFGQLEFPDNYKTESKVIDLLVLNDKDEIIDTITTNSDGGFAYTKTNTNEVKFLLSSDNDLVVENIIISAKSPKGLLADTNLLLAGNSSLMDTTESFIPSLDSASKLKFSINGILQAKKIILVYNDSGELIDKIETGEDGEFDYYNLEASYYVVDTVKVSADDLMMAISTVKDGVVNIEIGEHVNPQLTVYFAFDSHLISDSSKVKIDEFINQLNMSEIESIQMIGHTDGMGPDSYNDRLANKRAISVKAYFIAKGITMADYLIESKGEKASVASNNTIEGRRLNRRVNVIVN